MSDITRRQFGSTMICVTGGYLLLGGPLVAQEGGDDGGDGGGEGGSGGENQGESGSQGGGESSGDNGGEGASNDAGNAESGDPINEATGDRTQTSSDVTAACSDPTTDLSNTDWGNMFDSTANNQNSCLMDDPNGIAYDAEHATESTGDQPGFWDSQWFDFHFDLSLTALGVISTDPEFGSVSGSLPIPVGPEGGLYFTGDSEGGMGVGGYAGLPGAEAFGQIGETATGAPSIDFGVEVGPAQLNVGVDAGPMCEAGGRALYNLEQNLYDYYSTPMFGAPYP